VKKYKIFNIFTGLDETSSCFSAVQIILAYQFLNYWYKTKEWHPYSCSMP